jgi:hypothetical protein
MDFTIESRNGLLWTIATGLGSVHDAVAMYKKVFDGATELGTHLILVDCSAVTSVLSGLERYHLGCISAEYAHGFRESMALKVAVVGSPPVIDGFAAPVASNRGMTTETFSDTTNAVEWLNRLVGSV